MRVTLHKVAFCRTREPAWSHAFSRRDDIQRTSNRNKVDINISKCCQVVIEELVLIGIFIIGIALKQSLLNTSVNRPLYLVSFIATKINLRPIKRFNCLLWLALARIFCCKTDFCQCRVLT